MPSHIGGGRFSPYSVFANSNTPSAAAPVEVEVDDSSWSEIPHHTYWGAPRTNFILRTTFNVPNSWVGAGPVALFLPIGISGDFSHPEALAYIDGQPYAACDRHHQEIMLSEKYCDGETHSLALHGWTGIGGSTVGNKTTRLKMSPCEVGTNSSANT